MKPPYTPKQGQFLAFIHHYTTLHRRPPAEAELVQFFQVTPPSVHQMILTLERRGLISRTPGRARSIGLTVPPETLPPLQSESVFTRARLPGRQMEEGQPTDTDAILLRLGKIQIDELAAWQKRHPLDETKFVRLVDALIEAFTRVGASAWLMNELRRHASELYRRSRHETEPNK